MQDGISHAVTQLNDSSLWASVSPLSCQCGGHGWISSAYDTWHRCGVHGKGVPHPEWEDDDFDWGAHEVNCLDRALAAFKGYCDGRGMENFDAKVGEGSLKERVEKAEGIAHAERQVAQEEEAVAMGYKSHSHMMWSNL